VSTSPRPPRRSLIAASFLVATVLGACSNDTADTVASEPLGRDTTSTTAAAVPDHTSEVYADLQTWLCHPERGDDACDTDLDATLVRADGTTEVERFEPDVDAPIDCFFVYPTASDDPEANSDLVPSEAESQFVRFQIARFASTCRIYTPMHRQVTMAGLHGSDMDPDWDLAYADVLDAWKHYLANDNDGRGVVVIGHSQGASHLLRLLEEEIDGDEVVRDRLVSAVLAGKSVAVPEGGDVGGALQHIPLCRAADETGCLITYSIYAHDGPPIETSRFGTVAADLGRAACVNPAALDGGPGRLDSYLPTDRVPEGQLDPAIDTPFVRFDGLVEAECVDEGPFTYLRTKVVAEPDDQRPADVGGATLPGWGLHLFDLSLPQGSLVEVLGTQAEAHTG
jgi:hypothetical protein